MELQDQISKATNNEEYQISLQIGIFMIKYGSMLDVISHFEFSNIELALLADVPLSRVANLRDEFKL